MALLVITTALLGLAGTLGPVTSLAGQGRFKGRIALVLESRLDRLRAQLSGTSPDCLAPPAGVERHPDGIVETWTASARPGLIELLLTASAPGGASPDTVVSRLPCPWSDGQPEAITPWSGHRRRLR